MFVCESFGNLFGLYDKSSNTDAVVPWTAHKSYGRRPHLDENLNQKGKKKRISKQKEQAQHLLFYYNSHQLYETFVFFKLLGGNVVFFLVGATFVGAALGVLNTSSSRKGWLRTRLLVAL